MNNDYIAVLKMGIGNIYSVMNACKTVGLNTIITNDEKIINNSKGLIIPGVGSFKTAMSFIQSKKLDISIKNYIKSKRPIMGICLGMQIFYQTSEEFGLSHGLGLLKGRVKSFKYTELDDIRYPKTQIGWNSIHFQKNDMNHSIYNNIKDGSLMYFANSFFVEYSNDESSTFSFYGKEKFCSSYAYENLLLFQFHPEKSNKNGMLIYENFKKMIK